MMENILKIKGEAKSGKLLLIAACAAFALLFSVFASAQFNIGNAIAGFSIGEDDQPDEYLSAEAFENGHYECYRQYEKAVDAGKGFYIVNELLGPSCIAGGDPSEGNVAKAIDMFDPSLVNYDQNIMEQEWNAYWEAIGYVNVYMDNLEARGSDFIGETPKKMYYAECRVLRSMMYLDLITMFGPVPIVEHKYLQDSDYQGIGRNELQEICKWIISECDEALAALSERKDKRDYSIYWIQKGTAIFVKAEAYLLNKNDSDRFKNAKAELKKIIDSGKYDLLPGERLFAKYAVSSAVSGNGYDPNNEELMFGIFYDNENAGEPWNCEKYSATGKNPWVNKLGIRSYASNVSYPFYGSGAGMLNVTANFVYPFMVNDGLESWRWKSSLAFYSTTENGGELDTDENGSINGYDEWEHRVRQDKAKQVKWDNIVQNWRGSKMTGRSDPSSQEYPFKDYVGNGKYGPVNTLDGDLDKKFEKQTYSLMNYNEVLLLYAWACVKTGTGNEALPYINGLQSRANSKTVSANLNEPIVINETMWESVFSGNEYKYLMLIYGPELPDCANLFQYQNCETENGEIYTLGPNWTDHIAKGDTSYAYLPIPENALKTYGWEQNPGWVQ